MLDQQFLQRCLVWFSVPVTWIRIFVVSGVCRVIQVICLLDVCPESSLVQLPLRLSLLHHLSR